MVDLVEKVYHIDRAVTVPV